MVERLLSNAVDSIWRSHGMDGPPKTEAEWKELEQSLRG
jgi:hypothetical protein